MKSALVTGATGGIGAAVARALAADGYRVGVLARGGSRGSAGKGGGPRGSGRKGRTSPLEALAGEVGGLALPCDVSDATSVEAAVARLVDEFGGAPDLVVTAAGAFSLQTLGELTVAELERQLDVNLKGSILVARATVPPMVRRGSGHLVLVGSVAGRKPLPGNAAYGASKYGLRGFHEVLREELRGTGVRTTLLEPAATDTRLWDELDPDRRPDLPNRSDMLRPEEVAEAVRFAVSRPPGVQIPYLPIERVR